MDQLVEQETAPAAIEATLNYIENNGEKIFTYTGGPGSSKKRSGGTKDPRRVFIRQLARSWTMGPRVQAVSGEHRARFKASPL